MKAPSRRLAPRGPQSPSPVTQRPARSLQAELDEAGGREVTVEGERLADTKRAHDGETRRVDEGVRALVVPPQPAESIALERLGDEVDPYPRSFPEQIEHADRMRVAVASVDECPGLAANVIRREEPLTCVPLEEAHGVGMPIVTPGREGYPERRVDKDQSGCSSL